MEFSQLIKRGLNWLALSVGWLVGWLVGVGEEVVINRLGACYTFWCDEVLQLIFFE